MVEIPIFHIEYGICIVSFIIVLPGILAGLHPSRFRSIPAFGASRLFHTNSFREFTHKVQILICIPYQSDLSLAGSAVNNTQVSWMSETS